MCILNFECTIPLLHCIEYMFVIPASLKDVGFGVLFCFVFFLTLKLIEKEFNVFLVPGFLILFHMHLVSKQNSLS